MKRFSVPKLAGGTLAAGALLTLLLLRLVPINLAAYFNLLFVVKVQASLGADLNSVWVFDETPLMTTANESRQRVFRVLVDAGADLTKRTSSFYGETVMHRAAHDGCDSCVILLIEKKVDVNLRDSVGRTPLLFAVTMNQTTIAARLLIAGADPNLAVLNGFSPLMEATRQKNVGMIRLLLAHGASSEQHDDNGQSAMSIAKENSDRQIQSILEQSRLP